MSKATITIRMQSGHEFHFDGQAANDMNRMLYQPEAQATLSIPGKQGAEVMIASQYVESIEFFPKGNVDIGLGRPVADIEGLTLRTINVLKGGDIDTIGNLVTVTEQQLFLVPNLGARAIKEIKAALSDYGLRLSNA